MEDIKKAPIFSIIMPAYNVEKTVIESIESVLHQTFQDFELLVVNDSSNDNTKNIIEEYSREDPRIKLFNLDKNGGVAHARNIAIKQAKGKYLAFLDADDLWLHNKLEVQHSHLENGYDLIYSAYTMFRENGREKTIIPPEAASFEKLLKGNFIGNLTGAYNCKKLGKFYQLNIGHEDYLMWLEIAKKSERSLGISFPLARYRVGSTSVSSNKIKSIRWMWSIYRRHLAFGPIKSGYYFLQYIYNASVKRI